MSSSPGRRAGDRRKDRASSSTSQAETGDESPASEGHLPVGPLADAASAVEVEFLIGYEVWNLGRRVLIFFFSLNYQS